MAGSLITAEDAAIEGRDVYAVPGEITNPNCAGSNKLIQDGATGIYNIEDFVRDLGLDSGLSKEALKNLGADELKIIDSVRIHGELTTEELSAYTGMSPEYVNALITMLEIKGYVQTGMGRVFVSTLDGV
ncbi:MAG: DNA-processing protein DprA [Eubacteriales bacterium]|nr:DNA-processing protein DprA [Eubacteriales bacterium]